MDWVMHSTPLYKVTKRTFDNSDRLVIAFDNWQQIPDIEKQCFGEFYLSSRKINHITIKCGQNSWFQDEEFAEIIKSIQEAAAGSRMIGYGSSMGAYAAISFYEKLGFSDAIAFCPQYSIDSSKVPFEPRWRKEAANLNFRHDFVSSQPAIRKATVIYDPLHRWDSAHCGLIARYHPAVHFSRLPFSGHGPVEHLRRLGLLPEFVDSLLMNRFDPAKHRERIKATRASNGHYWVNMSSLNMRKRPKLALKAALNATKCLNAGELEKMQYEKVLKFLGIDEGDLFA